MKPFLLTLFSFFAFTTFSQNEIKWSFGFDAKSNELTYRADLDKDWHVYSTLPNDGGPVPTAFELSPSEIFAVKGTVLEPTPIKEHDPNFDMTVQYFGKSVTFKQAIEVKENGEISGNVVYMICNNQMCFPPEQIQFKIQISK